MRSELQDVVRCTVVKCEQFCTYKACTQLITCVYYNIECFTVENLVTQWVTRFRHWVTLWHSFSRSHSVDSGNGIIFY